MRFPWKGPRKSRVPWYDMHGRLFRRFSCEGSPMQIKPSKVGGVRFSAVAIRYRESVKIPHIALDSVVEWLGEGWSEEGCKKILEDEPWILEALCFTHEGRVFLSPLGVAMMVVSAGDGVSVEQKLAVSDLVIGWVSGRSKATKGLSSMQR